jgi:hypothetical protein
VGGRGTIGRVWVGPRTGFQALVGNVVEREPDRYMRGCFRVSQLGTDVQCVAACLFGPVGRCVSSADTSLSLSLSLSCLCSAPSLAADCPWTVRSAGRLSGVGRFLCVCGSRLVCRGLFERHRFFSRLVTFGGALLCTVVRAVGVNGERRGLNRGCGVLSGLVLGGCV